jgi:cation:H+ antiporter
MSDIEIALFLVGGLIMLFIGAEGLIRGSSNLAIRIGITPLVVGLTVVAFGTGSPELFVSLKAALNGNSTIVLGNVIGSNIANVALILGVAALIKPIKIQVRVLKIEIPIMIGFSVLLIILLMDGELSLIDGLIFSVSIITYTFIKIKLARKEKNRKVTSEFKEGLKSKLGTPISILLIIGGLTLLILGANAFVQGAIAIAKIFNISDAVIGLTVVAFGTSLPELVTSSVACFKNESDIAVGNVVGSNIFNILAILGITAVIIPISSAGISKVDLGVMIFMAVILLPLSKTGYSITRIEGAALLLGYIVYIYYLLPK